MREIKFRGRRIDNGEWVYGLPILLSYSELDGNWHYGIQYQTDRYACGITEIDPETLGQFTGLQDNEHIDMYKGDKVRGNYGIPSVVVESVIEWKDGGFFVDTTGHTPSIAGLGEAMECLDLTVIGNIHDKEQTNDR